ncbi:MAG TPA: hypothetical protein VFG73_08055 [Rhodanobacteraceae bacterium]|nr:hypothetical protein [Rhodanobacteraceae bacterium]
MAEILPFTARGTRPLLRAAQQRRQLVRIWRDGMERGSFCGYVGAVGREFVLMWVLGDHLDWDGMLALRLRDITEVEAPDKHAGFLEKALRLKRIEPRWPSTFALDDAVGVVASAVREADIVGVHVDGEAESEICYIGQVLDVDDDGFNMQEVSPDAEWLNEPSWFGWDELSSISFHDPYAEALLQVAGAPPPLAGDGDSDCRMR